MAVSYFSEIGIGDGLGLDQVDGPLQQVFQAVEQAEEAGSRAAVSPVDKLNAEIEIAAV